MNWYKNIKMSFSIKEMLKGMGLVIAPTLLGMILGNISENLYAKYHQNPQELKLEIIEKAEDNNYDIKEENGKIIIEEQKKQLDIKDYTKFTSPYEGFSNKVYKDTNGNSTIGFGTNIEQNANGKNKIESIGRDYYKILNRQETINEEEAETLIQKDIQKALLNAQEIFKNRYDEFPDNLKMILTDMIYNMGKGFEGSGYIKGRGFLSLQKFINEIKKPKPNWNLASGYLEKTRWYNQVGQRSKHHVEEIRKLNN